jgi:hypothetical protein
VPRETTGGLKIADKIAELGEAWLVETEEGRAVVAAVHAEYMAEMESLHRKHHASFGDPVPLELN